MELTPAIPYGQLLVKSRGKEIYWNSTGNKKSLLQSLVVELLLQDIHPTIIYDNKDSSWIADWFSLVWHFGEKEIPQKIDHLLQENTINALRQKIKGYHFTKKQSDHFHLKRSSTCFGALKIESVIETCIELQQKFPADELLADLHAIPFEFNYTEYGNLQDKVLRGSKLFRTSFTFLDEHNVFNDSIFINKEGEFSTSVLLKYLSNFQSKAQLLTRSFGEFLSKITAEKKHFYNQQIHSLNESIELLEYDCIESQENWSKPIKNNLQTELHNILSTYNKTFDKDFNIDKFSDAVQALDAVQKLKQQVLSTSKELHHYIRAFEKSINIKNVNDPFVENIEKQIDQWIKAINDSAIFKKDFENNAISLWKQFLNLKKISNLISMAQNQLMEMGKYYDWKAFVVPLKKSERKLIESLKNIATKDWLIAFNSWYYHNVLTHFKTQERAVPNQDENELNLEDVIQYKRYKALSEIQIKYPKLFSKMTKKIEDASSIFIQENHKRFFPVLSGIQFKTKEQTIAENTICIDLTGLHHHSPENKYSFHSIASSYNQDGLLPMADLVPEKLSTVDLNQKLQLATFLAKHLAKDAERMHLYLSKKSNIIFNISPWLRSKIIQEMDLSKLKQWRLEKPFDKAITEYLLNDSEEAVYIYDRTYSKDSDLGEYYKKKIIDQCIEKAGYQLIFVDLWKMLEDDFYLSDILSEIEL